jgi:hypothetical protein
LAPRIQDVRWGENKFKSEGYKTKGIQIGKAIEIRMESIFFIHSFFGLL